MAERAEEGRRYRVKPGAFSWNVHYNDQEVVALESYESASAEVEVRCDCGCGDTTRVLVADLDS